MVYRFQRTLCDRLLAWAFLSFVTGLGVWLSAGGDDFSAGLALQFALWGAVDAGIAFFGLRGLAEQIRLDPEPRRDTAAAARLRRLLWINTGLDVLYIAGGLALMLGPGQTSAFARGSGLGVLIQGGFLFIFDLLHALSIPTEQRVPPMPRFDQPEHSPFDLPGERGIVILVHGFPGTPVEMRDLGQALNRAGWRAVGLLLPGYGSQIESLFQQRAGGWVDAIAAAVEQARAQTRGPVVLAGFSMGGGLSVSAAVRARPDALALIAPFWIDLGPIRSALLRAAFIFLPETFNPFRLIPANQLAASKHFHPPPGDLYPPAPEFFRGLSGGMNLPLLFLEQFLEFSNQLKRNAPRITCPVLIVQGDHDPIVRPAQTRRVAAMLSAPPRYVSVAGAHHITVPAAPGYAELETALIDFIGAP